MDDPRRKLVLRLLPVVAIAAVVLVLYVWHRRSVMPAPGPGESTPETPPETLPNVPAESAYGPLERQWLEATGSTPEWPGDFDRPADCRAALDRLRTLASRLDRESPPGGRDLPRNAFALMMKTASTLAERTPPIAGLLRDAEAMRLNVTYLYRMLGAARVARIVELVHDRPEMAEPFALAAYRWLRAGGDCEPGLRPPDPDVQYEYAVFLLRTIGGQAYLRRLDPRLEALVSFYSLLIADHAIERGHNPEGFDPRREMARCRALVRGQPLLFRERYLDVLDGLERRWKDRAAVP